MLGWPWVLSNARMATFFQLDSWPSVSRFQDRQEEKNWQQKKAFAPASLKEQRRRARNV